MQKTRRLAIAAALLASFAGGARAEVFIGGAIGEGHADIDLNIDKTATGGKVFGGYRFSNGFAVEATYFYYGKLSASGLIEGRSASANLEGTAPALGVAYFDQSDRIVFVARAGIGRNKAELSGTVSGIGSASTSATSTRPYLGISVGYRINQNLSIDLAGDFTKFEFMGDTGNTRLISLGLTARFY